MSASSTSNAFRPDDKAMLAASASEDPKPDSGLALTTCVQPRANPAPSGPVTTMPGPSPACSTASSTHRPSGLPTQSASILPPPKRVPRPAARPATSGVSAMRLEPLVGTYDLGQHRPGQPAGLPDVRVHAPPAPGPPPPPAAGPPPRAA